MNIAIIGYGKMGRVVERIAKARGHAVKAIIDPQAEGATYKEINAESLNSVDVCIEFSLPDGIMENMKRVADAGVNHVVATTGWHGKINEARKIIKASKTGLIYAPNFSIGVNIFYRIIANAAKILNKIEAYDVFGYELHHTRKKDSPSGTAKAIEKVLLDNFTRKKKVVEDKLDRAIAKDELHFTSIRAGDIPGTHVVAFDSSADTIELKHTARNREGFALGSVMAAEWIANKKGFFSMDNMLKEVLKNV